MLVKSSIKSISNNIERFAVLLTISLVIISGIPLTGAHHLGSMDDHLFNGTGSLSEEAIDVTQTNSLLTPSFSNGKANWTYMLIVGADNGNDGGPAYQVKQRFETGSLGSSNDVNCIVLYDGKTNSGYYY